MATYTMTLEAVIKIANIFDFNYNLYDETKKKDLEQAFIDHYLFKEIGVETIGRFKHKLRERWILILPKYNKLWIANNKDVEIFSNNKGSSKRVSNFNDLPITPPTSKSDYPTTSTDEISSYSSLSGISEIEALSRYNELVSNITFQFLKEFISLFMSIY